VWVDGGIDTGDAAQRQALEDLAAADIVGRLQIVSGRRHGCVSG
jgi:hypothetical protein